ncbi:MAG: hypothetical protein ACKOW8_06115 [Flavobacteriales bacterium]
MNSEAHILVDYETEVFITASLYDHRNFRVKSLTIKGPRKAEYREMRNLAAATTSAYIHVTLHLNKI